LLDVICRFATLYVSAETVETAWKFVMPILSYWEQERALNLPEYQCGTWGPVEADRLIEADGRTWRTL